MTFKTVIFDMDGVLVDTEKFYYERRSAFFDGEGIDIGIFPKNTFIGGDMREIWPQILGDVSQAAIQDFQRKYNNYKESHPLPYGDLLNPGALELLTYLRNKSVKIGLASNSRREDIVRCLMETKLTSYFDLTLSGEEVRQPKPSSDVYVQIIEKLGGHRRTTLVIEDSEKGIEAALPVVDQVWAIKIREFEVDQTKADYLLGGLEAVLQKLSSENLV